MRILLGRAFSMPNQQQIIVICLYILDGSSPLLSLLLLSYLIQLCCTLGTTNTSDRHRPISPGAMKWTDPCQLHRPTSFSPRVVASDLPESTFCHCVLRCPVLMSVVVLAGTSRHNIHSSLISSHVVSQLKPRCCERRPLLHPSMPHSFDSLCLLLSLI